MRLVFPSRAVHRLSRPLSVGVVLLGTLCLGSGLQAQTNVRGGSGSVVLVDSVHPVNHNIYDQVLLTGRTVTVAADPGQVVRVSFLDDNEDITQVEFAGSGTVTIELDPATYAPPAPARKYNQPGVAYVKGHATVRVRDARADTFVSVFSVGRGNAVNQALFPVGMSYDAMADIQLLQVEGPQCGGILTGNARYTGASGATGIHAPDTRVYQRVIVGEIQASGDATPLLRLGDGSALAWDAGAVLIAGGQLQQRNHTPVDVSSGSGSPLAQLRSVDGTLSSGELRPASACAAEFASRNAGAVSVNHTARATRGFIPTSFSQLLEEAGFAAFDFGDGVQLRFSGGNSGSYSYTETAVIDGESVRLQMTGTYTYTVGPADRNHMVFSLTFGTISLTSGSLSFQGSIYDLARLAEEPLPVQITATADFTSSVSGSATTTLLWSNGRQESVHGSFDLDHALDFEFL